MFYKKNIDIASVKSMWMFLHEHFTYYTMSSWNRHKSIANNVKLYNLDLDGDWTVVMRYLFDEEDCGGLQLAIDEEIRAFEESNPAFKISFNGRSNGYLVLYNAENNLSILPECLDYDSYEDFKADVKDYGYTLSDYFLELRQATEIVREFDKLCDRLRDIVNSYSNCSFDSDKLAAAVYYFNDAYSYDLYALGLEGPKMDEGRLKMNCLAEYLAFMHCFLECLGEDRTRVTTNGTHLWLKEA